LIASSKKGISSNQLHRILGITFKSAWHLPHRIRLAMDEQIGKQDEGGGIDSELLSYKRISSSM